MGMAPTRAGLDMELMIDKRTVGDWAKKIPEFSHAVKVLDTIQEDMLIHKGLTNKWNPFLVQFLLKNNHGYKAVVDFDARIEIGTQVFLVGGQEIIFLYHLEL